MYQDVKPLFLICETPLHPGSGAELGFIDLPIQREKHTGFPKIEASSLKGAIREAFENEFVKKTTNSDSENSKKEHLKKINQIFGYDESPLHGFSSDELKKLFTENDEEKTDFAGCLSVADARLLLFPVKSLYGVFAWTTCKRVLNRFLQDMKMSNISCDFELKDLKDSNIFICENAGIEKNNAIYLEEFVFKQPKKSKTLNKLGLWLKENVLKDYNEYWQYKIEHDIVVLPDEIFRDFVNLSTEVITRIKIDNQTGTVETGALFTEEYLPAESLLYTLVMFADEFTDNKSKLTAQNVKSYFSKIPRVIQVGGNSTLGKGIISTKFLES